MANTTIHFHSSDDRFCGSKEVARQFTLEPNDVTCGACQAKDTFTLSPSGRACLAGLGYVDAQGNIS